MSKSNYSVSLKKEEREELLKIVSSGKLAAKEIRRSNILLATDDNRIPKLTVREVAQLFNVSPRPYKQYGRVIQNKELRPQYIERNVRHHQSRLR